MGGGARSCGGRVLVHHDWVFLQRRHGAVIAVIAGTGTGATTVAVVVIVGGE